MIGAFLIGDADSVGFLPKKIHHVDGLFRFMDPEYGPEPLLLADFRMVQSKLETEPARDRSDVSG